MKITAALLTIVGALSLGVSSAQAIDDVTILNYALTLEHLENAFYSGIIANYNSGDFRKAGYPRWIYQRVQTLATQEASHVAFLAGALGDAATKPCTYDFGYKSLKEALAISRVLESVGVSAYLGAAPDITEDAYLTAAGAILTIEARHQAVVAEINEGLGYPSAYDTPLKYSNVFSLAAPFITGCPASNPTLPVTQFPKLTATAPVQRGQNVQLRFDVQTQGQILYAHVLSGLSDIVVQLKPNNSFDFPTGIDGVAYVIISDSETLADNNTIAGPMYVQLSDKVDASFVVRRRPTGH